MVYRFDKKEFERLRKTLNAIKVKKNDTIDIIIKPQVTIEIV